jgi:hypothetical protein
VVCGRARGVRLAECMEECLLSERHEVAPELDEPVVDCVAGLMLKAYLEQRPLMGAETEL